MLNSFDQIGGAARAASRLLQGERALGADASLLVHYRTGRAEGTVCQAGPVRALGRRLKMALGTLPVRRYPLAPLNNFSPALLPDHLLAEVNVGNPDIIHLHWLGAGALRIETLGKIKKPLVWTLHDSWAFTGGCHVSFECTKYLQNCGSCPVLGSENERDLSRQTWQRKVNAWRGLDLTLVAPSRWLAACCQSSSLFRDLPVEVIPNGLDTETFRPQDKQAAREQLGLPQERRIILFGGMRAADDKNKGLHLLLPALRSLAATFADFQSAAFSSHDSKAIPETGMPLRAFGPIKDDQTLTALYSAADVFVVPSLQEAFCQTATEAMACGTPVVAFNATGLQDVVEHQKTGYLAKPYESDDLARGIAWVLADGDRHQKLSRQARHKVTTDFALDKVARTYLRLYQRVLEGRTS